MGFDLVLTVRADMVVATRSASRRNGVLVLCPALRNRPRAVIELWRGDDFRGVFLDGAISTSQILSRRRHPSGAGHVAARTPPLARAGFPMTEKTRVLVVGDDDAGIRLDRFLTARADLTHPLERWVE